MSMVGISIILLVKATYGNYTLAGAVAASNIIALAFAAPPLARLVDRYGQRRVMGPALAVSVAALIAFTVAASLAAPVWLLFVLAAIAGATWGSPGALVRSRWKSVSRTSQHLSSAYALEAAVDEVIFITGPILSTVLGALIHPSVGLILSALFLAFGGLVFLSQRSTEPVLLPVTSHTEKQRSVLRDPVVLVLIVTYVGAGALFGANDVSVLAFTEERGVPAMSGVLLALMAAGSLVSALIYGARTWLQPLWKLFAVGVVALTLGVSTFLFAHDIRVLGFALMLAGAACAPTLTNVNMIVTKVVPPAQLTEGLAWMSTAMNIGVSLGSAAAGPAVDTTDSHGGFLVMVAFAWFMVAVMLIGLPRLRRGVDAAEMRLHASIVAS